MDLRNRGLGRLSWRTPGRVLGVKTGVNPNSSSLGVSATWLLLWGGAVAVLGPALGLLVRGLVARSKEEA